MASAPSIQILFVDDQPANLAVLEAILADLDVASVSVTSGEAALREVLARDFAVVLLDVRMPTMNGFELARLVRGHPRTQGLPIIFLTAGDAEDFPVEEAYALGAVDYMTKPFNPVVLRAKVGVFIELYRQRAELARIEAERHRAALQTRDEELARSEQQAAAERERLVRELRAANERMRDIFHRAPAFMCVMRGPAHAIELANQRFLELAGGRALDGRPVREALPELDGQGFADVLDGVYASGEAFEGRNLRMLLKVPGLEGARAGLEEHYLDFVCMAMREPDGSVSGVLVHGIDVSERTRANLLAVGQRGALELAVTDAPLGDVLDVLARTAEDTGGGNALASVQLLGFDGRLRHAAAPSLPSGFLLAADALPIGPDAGPAARAAWSGAAASCAGLDEDPLWGALAGAMRAHALAAGRALPILAPSGQVLGTFTLYYREARAPNAQEEAAMALLANTASLVIGQRHEAAERQRAEEGVRRLAAVAEQSSDFIGIFTPDAGGIYLNPAGRRMAGLDGDTNIAAWRMLDFFPREDRAFVRDRVMAALAGPPAEWEGELRLARPDGGAPLPVYFKGFAVRGADGHTIGLATITRDITLQKDAEDELRRVAADLSEADHRKSEFLATLAHELRNPLAPIRSGLDLLRTTRRGPSSGRREDDATAQRVHAMMDRQLGHLIHLVDDLLDIARITRGKIELKKEPVPLDAIVNTAVETSAALIEAHGHRLEVALPVEPLELEADVTRMVQVLSNLLNNAAKYTPKGGRITLSCRREDGHAVIVVADDGIGIPGDAIGSVFEMFTQVRGSLDRAQGGLGIGLSLVRRLVELHGGRVSAFSGGPGAGCTFTVRLPLRPGSPHARTREPDAVDGDSSTAPLRVLVVDDNVDAAESLVALLEMLGHSVQVAHDGPDGLRLAYEFAPELVLLDIGLPGMSGYDVARAIRRNAELDGDLPRMVLIALTGWGGEGDQRQSHEAGFDQHMTKPVSLEALEQALATAARALT